jgi:hypothetical protein
MNFLDFIHIIAEVDLGLLGLIFVLIFVLLLIIVSAILRDRQRKSRPRVGFREILPLSHLKRATGMAVETGQRMHFSLGRGAMIGIQSASGLVGLSMLNQISRTTLISDKPTIATSGEGSLAILSQDTIRNAYRSAGMGHLFDPSSGQLSGATPFSYAGGVLPVIYDQQVTMTVLNGHVGSEVALITDASAQNNQQMVAGSDDLSAQAVILATCNDPLIGEEVYAGGAYLNRRFMHIASLVVQDIMRWIIVLIILAGITLKMAGIL